MRKLLDKTKILNCDIAMTIQVYLNYISFTLLYGRDFASLNESGS